jgi:hypothetical protein
MSEHVQALADAIQIVHDTRLQFAQKIQPIWDKLYRVGCYLDKQLEAELKEVLA